MKTEGAAAVDPRKTVGRWGKAFLPLRFRLGKARGRQQRIRLQETLLSYFGEAFCGIISEGIQVVGQRTWTIPVFLFRMHNTAGEHIHRLIYGDPVPHEITGRTGSDFIALCLDASRNVQAVLVGEAKCHTTLNITKARKALEDLGKQAATPVSLGQLKRVMLELPTRDWCQTVQSIEKILLTRAQVDRTDLFVYLFENPGIKEYTAPRLPRTVAVETHGVRRPLQIVEVCVPDLGNLVSDVYQALYASERVSSATN